MRYQEAEALRLSLYATAVKDGILNKDGKPLQFKTYHPNEGQKGRLTVDGWTVKSVTLRQETNLQAGNKFWIDEDTPNFLNPGRDAYYD